MTRQPKTIFSPEEYLKRERRAESKSEYFDGEICAMTGASRNHNLIVINIASELRHQLKGKPCEVYASDMRVRVPSANVYTYPDVVVVCGEPQFEDAEVDTLLNPTLIVEVLSRSTEGYDRVTKFGYYRTIGALAEYLIVAQDAHHVEHCLRQTDAPWLLMDYGSPEAKVELPSLGCVLHLAEAYDKVSFN